MAYLMALVIPPLGIILKTYSIKERTIGDCLAFVCNTLMFFTSVYLIRNATDPLSLINSELVFFTQVSMGPTTLRLFSIIHAVLFVVGKDITHSRTMKEA